LIKKSQKKNLFLDKIIKKLEGTTYKSIVPTVLKNAKKNRKYLKYGKSIENLKGYKFNKGKVAVVVASGPSLRRYNQIEILKKYKNRLIIISADGALYYLLDNGIVPDLVITLDPHPTRIVRWFGDTKLTKSKIEKDDYFLRQDLETDFRKEISSNKKNTNLFNKFSKKINIAVCTSSSLAVVKRLVSSKSKIYWWNPFLDEPKNKNSATRKIYKINKMPIINSGGNAGAAAWMFADSVLKVDKIALLGMDFSYYMDTPIKNTQYYDRISKLTKKENIKSFFKKIYNPKEKKFFYSDYVYIWYKEIFLEMVNNTNTKTFNCSKAGIIFENGIVWTSLKKFCKINL
tara:strand:- start:380 stop:1414 length:1035 start_codon:yes stop_codon:yes gene_type:complete